MLSLDMRALLENNKGFCSKIRTRGKMPIAPVNFLSHPVISFLSPSPSVHGGYSGRAQYHECSAFRLKVLL